MATRTVMMVGAAALALTGGAIGIASAKDRAIDDAKAAQAANGRAAKALAQHRSSVADAEVAVTLAPRDPAFRLVLGQSYMAVGRFASARTAFADTLVLDPGNAKAALNLALTQIATGDWAGARATLDANSARISPADRGLALALSGDTAGAIALLNAAAREADATPKTRQNLALALALAGQWPAARAVAAVDVSPGDLDARLQQWAALARPHAAADQVAALIGVTPVEDPGQPVQLALGGMSTSLPILAQSAPAPMVAMAAPAPVIAMAAPAPAPVVEIAVPAAVPLIRAPGFAQAVVFGPRAEVVQPLPARAELAATIRADHGPIKVAIAAAAPTGTWFVQLGAYRTTVLAKEGWGKALRRLPALAPRGPSGVSFAARNVYRLSVGGYSRDAAVTMCRQFRSKGGDCFVRQGAGDQIAAWVHKPIQMASR